LSDPRPGHEERYLAVYDEIAEELCSRVRAAWEGPSSWHDRIWAAGWAALRFFEVHPGRARLFIVDVNGAGSRPQAHRDRLLQGLADLLDGGRGELEDPAAVSRCTAEIAAGAVYGTLLARVKAGCLERREDFLPELVYMAVLPYLGAEAAEQELLVQPLR